MAARVLRCSDMYRPVVQKAGSCQVHLIRLAGFPCGWDLLICHNFLIELWDIRQMKADKHHHHHQFIKVYV